MTNVIACCNQKGGTGKTTTVANLGIGLAMEGKKVLLTDCDPQGSLSISLGNPYPDRLPVTLATVMGKVLNEEPIDPGEGLLHHDEGVDLMPANIELSGMEVSLVNAMSREKILKQYLDGMKRQYDYVLLDCMPSLGMLTVNALAAADSVLIPVQAQYLPAKGLEQLLQTINKVRRQINPKLKIDGILLTMVDSRTNYAKEISALLRDKAGLSMTPQEYTARKYLIVAAGAALAALCCCLNFLFGAFVAVLGMIFALMKQRDTLDVKIRKKERMISQEMPRFVRTICRSLQSDRDLYNVISAYRKVAGPELGGDLDILLTEIKSGNVQTALIHFENRLESPEAFRLCAALRDMSLGIDQTATLSYMADDMARQAKENIRKELSLRPGKMRRTYYPAIGVCIAMILYVLVVYVINNLNSIV